MEDRAEAGAGESAPPQEPCAKSLSGEDVKTTDTDGLGRVTESDEEASDLACRGTTEPPLAMKKMRSIGRENATPSTRGVRKVMPTADVEAQADLERLAQEAADMIKKVEDARQQRAEAEAATRAEEDSLLEQAKEAERYARDAVARRQQMNASRRATLLQAQKKAEAEFNASGGSERMALQAPAMPDDEGSGVAAAAGAAVIGGAELVVGAGASLLSMAYNITGDVVDAMGAGTSPKAKAAPTMLPGGKKIARRPDDPEEQAGGDGGAPPDEDDLRPMQRSRTGADGGAADRPRRRLPATKEETSDELQVDRQPTGEQAMVATPSMYLPKEPAGDCLPGPLSKSLSSVGFESQLDKMTTVLETVIPKLNLTVEAGYLFADKWTSECLLYEFFEVQRANNMKVGPWLQAPGAKKLRLRELSATMPLPPKPMCPKEARVSVTYRIYCQEDSETGEVAALSIKSSFQTHDVPFSDYFTVQEFLSLQAEGTGEGAGVRVRKAFKVVWSKQTWLVNIVESNTKFQQEEVGKLFLDVLNRRASGEPPTCIVDLWELQRRATLFNDDWYAPFLPHDGSKQWRWVTTDYEIHPWTSGTLETASVSDEPPLLAPKSWQIDSNGWTLAELAGPGVDEDGWQYAADFYMSEDNYFNTGGWFHCRRRLWTSSYLKVQEKDEEEAEEPEKRPSPLLVKCMPVREAFASVHRLLRAKTAGLREKKV